MTDSTLDTTTVLVGMPGGLLTAFLMVVGLLQGGSEGLALAVLAPMAHASMFGTLLYLRAVK